MLKTTVTCFCLRLVLTLRRMREWLFNIMKDLARRKALDAEYAKLEKESEQGQGRQWVNAVIWKFCDLDVEPENR